ncbi:hypothetical protein N7470_007255 [Penicillium chermesinum]|nr:hypothetical protein N7470_007255 [Penicillium chermesinum]
MACRWWAFCLRPRYPLPARVELGYEIHEAIFFDERPSVVKSSHHRKLADTITFPTSVSVSLRKADRFDAPLKPLTNRSTVNKGDKGAICPQAFPIWYLRMLAELKHDTDALKKAEDDPTSLIPPPDPREQEDCLFLDVLVPEEVLQNRYNESYRGAPVMVWLYGGGFTFTDDSGNPAGLIAASKESSAGSDGVIYVKINYRGGAFGFLSGPEIQSNGTANAGLLDQRLALEWVQEHIRQFGGDPDRVTLFGQSAGAASILHKITAYGGARGPVRKLPFRSLVVVNSKLVAASRYGQFTFAPSVDCSFVPALPGQLLFDKNLSIMTGHNAHETIFFIDPNSTTDADFRKNLKASLPAIQESIVDYVSETLYPPPGNRSAAIGYTTAAGRNELSSSEVSFTCNTNYLAQDFSAINPLTFAYQFSIPPAYHGEDVAYVYYNGPSPQVINTTNAHALQTYYTQFAITGQPNEVGFPDFRPYGSGKQILDLNVTGMSMMDDPTNNPRCHWWQLALYFKIS